MFLRNVDKFLPDYTALQTNHYRKTLKSHNVYLYSETVLSLKVNEVIYDEFSYFIFRRSQALFWAERPFICTQASCPASIGRVEK
jgi:hypothetical protein